MNMHCFCKLHLRTSTCIPQYGISIHSLTLLGIFSWCLWALSTSSQPFVCEQQGSWGQQNWVSDRRHYEQHKDVEMACCQYSCSPSIRGNFWPSLNMLKYIMLQGGCCAILHYFSESLTRITTHFPENPNFWMILPLLYFLFVGTLSSTSTAIPGPPIGVCFFSSHHSLAHCLNAWK